MKSKIISVEAAFKYTDRDIKVLELYKQFPEKDSAWLEAGYKEMVIIEALNKEDNGGVKWEPDFENYNERKYTNWVWFIKDEAGSGWVVADATYDFTYTDSSVGLRLCLKNPEHVDYLNSQFPDIIQIKMAE